MPDDIQTSLGQFLRSRRERLRPEAVGLTDRRRRRTPGLRREEVAELAGIGVDWYLRLEQGRSVTPSVTTIDALARALRLNSEEHAHLRALCRNADRRAFVPETVPESLRHLVEALVQPAYVTGSRWDVLVWNAAAVDLFTDFGAREEADRNILVYLLLDPQARRLFGEGWAAEARRVVANFHAAHDLWSGDPAFSALLGRLERGCPEFAAWWEAHDVGTSTSGRKRLHPAGQAALDVEFYTFQTNDDPGLKLTIYTIA